MGMVEACIFESPTQARRLGIADHKQLQAERSGHRAQVDVSRSEPHSRRRPMPRRKECRLLHTRGRSCPEELLLALGFGRMPIQPEVWRCPDFGPVPSRTEWNLHGDAVSLLGAELHTLGLDLAKTLCNRSAGAWITVRLRVFEMGGPKTPAKR